METGESNTSDGVWVRIGFVIGSSKYLDTET